MTDVTVYTVLATLLVGLGLPALSLYFGKRSAARLDATERSPEAGRAAR